MQRKIDGNASVLATEGFDDMLPEVAAGTDAMNENYDIIAFTSIDTAHSPGRRANVLAEPVYGKACVHCATWDSDDSGNSSGVSTNKIGLNVTGELSQMKRS
ncbi:hypothetical protein [Nocardia sp. NPDC004260]